MKKLMCALIAVAAVGSMRAGFDDTMRLQNALRKHLGEMALESQEKLADVATLEQKYATLIPMALKHGQKGIQELVRQIQDDLRDLCKVAEAKQKHVAVVNEMFIDLINESEKELQHVKNKMMEMYHKNGDLHQRGMSASDDYDQDSDYNGMHSTRRTYKTYGSNNNGMNSSSHYGSTGHSSATTYSTDYDNQ